MERKLASIQKVLKVEPLINSDRLDIVTVLGWKVVVGRDQFKVDDLCVYFEIDSILDKVFTEENPEYELLAKTKFRLKTARIRGQISQGLVCTIESVVPKDIISDIHEGMDLTKVLKVGKYEPVISFDMDGVSKGFHPTSVRKTGEMRVQSALQLFEEFKGLLVARTTKIEGTSASYIMNKGVYDVCSHTHSMVYNDKSLYWKMDKQYNIQKVLEGKNLAIQGEIAGEGILGNRLGLKGLHLFVFRITDLNTGKRFTPTQIIDFCNQYGLEHVPMELNVLFDYETIDEVIASAEGFYELSGVPREGVVYVPMELTYSEYLCDWLSMKVINNVYLLGEWKKTYRPVNTSVNKEIIKNALLDAFKDDTDMLELIKGFKTLKASSGQLKIESVLRSLTPEDISLIESKGFTVELFAEGKHKIKMVNKEE